MPFIPNIRASTYLTCDCGKEHDMEGELLRRDNTVPFHPSNDGVANTDGRGKSATIRTPLNEWSMSKKMRHVAEWMARNFANPVLMRQAAELVAMSERTLLRNFRREIGVTPSAYLTHVRLAHACTMLEHTALPVDSIARRCGLGSGDYLAHLFRQHFNRTTTDYRQACSNAVTHVACRYGTCNLFRPIPPDKESGR